MSLIKRGNGIPGRVNKKIIYIRKGYNPNSKGKPFSKGENNPNWKGGITKRDKYPFNFNEELKKLIRNRDNYKCQMCGCPQEECIRRLDVHHKDDNKSNLNPDNLISLCRSCHSKVTVKIMEGR